MKGEFLRGKAGIIPAVAAAILLRNVNAASLVVAPDVLPKIGQLQGSASVVRELLPLAIAVTAKVKNKVAHWIG